jgi:predicted aconitase/predicted aconitase with swiveling domain
MVDTMPELFTKQQISWLDDVDKEGNIINPKHELYGKNIAGSILHMPAASGSTVGADRLVNLAVHGKAPKKIVLERTDPITMWGAILGNVDLEIEGREKKPIDRSKLDKLGLEPEIAEFLARAGELLGTDEFIPADYVQIAGVSYKTITETGLELRRYFASKYRFRARNVTINPAGMDLEAWQRQNIPKEFAEKQKEIIDLYIKMGALPTITCTPYLVGNTPPPFTDAFLSESSVVTLENSLFAVRSNREAGLSTLLYAIAGYGPRYGLHLQENRKPKLEVKVETELSGAVDYGLLGYKIGELANGRIPYITGISSLPTIEEFKELAAASAASGSVDLMHIEGITPEAKHKMVRLDSIEEKVEIDRQTLNDLKEELNTAVPEEIDLLAIGCPHASINEIKEVATLIKGKHLKAGKQLWITTSRTVKEIAQKLGYVSIIEEAGGQVVADTCMVVSPIEDLGFATTATNSGKAAKYLPRFCKQKVVFDDIQTLLSKIIE